MPQYEVIFKNKFQWPKSLAKSSLLICDRRLSRWATGFEKCHFLSAGERLKNVDDFPSHIKAIVKKFDRLSGSESRILSVGGGSIGDFAGFVASVLKRGVPLYHAPSTWLAAIDSAHGGKTALNVGGYKNQIGSFYPAEKTFLIKELLLNQPVQLRDQGYFELFKAGLVGNSELVGLIERAKKIDDASMWRLLPTAIESKLKIVRRDPFEKKGERRVLNFGHTLGHVFESELGLPHGFAVGHGMKFALRWSRHRQILGRAAFDRAMHVLERVELPDLQGRKKLTESQLLRALRKDKKRDGEKIDFIFLHRVGHAKRQQVLPAQIVKEWKRQQQAGASE